MNDLSIGIIISAYLAPTFIALMRHHHNVSGVFLVNLLTGWTGLGWIAALVMACVSGPQPQDAPAKYDVYTGERLPR